MLEMLKDKVVLITGGTGSFGSALLERIINNDVKEVRIFSRDERKQEELRRRLHNPKIKFFIGDVRNMESLDIPMQDVDYVFHAAALKQVPNCEYFPKEAVYTNILGTSNVIECAIKNKVKKIVAISTDKAVYAVSAMGFTKGLMEKVCLARSRQLDENGTQICITRFGNVIGTSGSVIPFFYSLIEKNEDLTITEPTMTRYMMGIDDAINLLLFALENGNQGDIIVKKMPAVNIEDLAKAIIKYKNSNVGIKIVGKRPGEKEDEALLTKEELEVVDDLQEYYRIPLDGKVQNENVNPEGYTSKNTKQLTVDEMIELLKKNM